MSETTDPAEAKRPALDQLQVEMRLETILARFPGRYDDAQIAAIRLHIGESVDGARALHAVQLTNADEPAIRLVP